MANPKDTQDTDGVENPRMTGDSADQMFDDDTRENDEEAFAQGQQSRAGGRGGLGSGGKDVGRGE